MRDPLQSQLSAWSEAARKPLPMPTTLAARVRHRRVQRLAPPILTAATLALTLVASLVIALNQGPARPLSPWDGPPRGDSLAFFDLPLPLTPVRWAPAQPLRAGDCRTPECVESWFEGG
ncbi:hypothetical protein PHYC_03736 [Phycisphaerales bacterium]|nr:hypothetical protein PHYC_03736 [Phycisphaerales bacterium]